MRTLQSHTPTDDGFDKDLIAHARSAMVKVHMTDDVQGEKKNKKKLETKDTKTPAVSAKSTKISKKTKSDKPEMKITYISTKKPPQRSTFYQHSKNGMKYWYEEKVPKSYSSKIEMGRKGTLLGIADSLLK